MPNIAAHGGSPANIAAMPMRYAGLDATLDINPVAGTAYNAGASSIAAQIACSRASQGYYTKADGTLDLFGNDTLRTGSQGILREAAGSNLCLQSQTFDNAAWTQGGVTISANAIAAPDGTTTADKIQENGSNSLHRLSQVVSVTTPGRFAHSVYVKAAERNQVKFTLYWGDFLDTVIDLTTGAKVSWQDSINAVNVVERYKAEPLANGWWRVQHSGNIPSGTTSVTLYVGPDLNAAGAYQGVAGSGIYVWGSQFEVADDATSYIPATTTAASRAADVITFSDVSWLDGDNDTILLEWGMTGNGSGGATVLALDATNDKAVDEQARPTSFSARIAGATSFSSALRGEVVRSAARLKANDFAISFNGATPALDTSETAPGPLIAARLGSDLAGAHSLNGYIRRIACFKGSALSDIALTQLAAKSVTDIQTLGRVHVQRSFGVFLHFNIATFADVQLATGAEDPNIFNPTSLNFDQWLDAIQDAGGAFVSPTIKHTDGFCWWPSASQPRNISATSWYAANGSPDLLSVFYAKCVGRGIDFIPYFSIFDGKFEIDHPSPSNTVYTRFVLDQLQEIKDRCPDIKGIWTDSWGWYTGYLKVSWQAVRDKMLELWPNALLFENNHFYSTFTDIAIHELPVEAGLSIGNTLNGQNADTIYADAVDGGRWFWNTTNVIGKTSSSVSAAIATANARNGSYMLNIGPGTDGLIGAGELAVLSGV